MFKDIARAVADAAELPLYGFVVMLVVSEGVRLSHGQLPKKRQKPRRLDRGFCVGWQPKSTEF
jgi:hypothetical protein